MLKRTTKPGSAKDTESAILKRIDKETTLSTISKDGLLELDEEEKAVKRKEKLATQSQTTYKQLIAEEGEKFLKTVASMVSIGATHQDLGRHFGVSTRSIEYWLVRYGEFKEAYEDGEKESVQRMRQNIFKMGNGYEDEAVAIILGKEEEFDPRTGRRISATSKVIEHHYKKKIQKNGWAANRFLEMHDKEWKPQATVTTNQINIQNNFDLTVYTDEELKALEKMGMKKMIEGAKTEE